MNYIFTGTGRCGTGFVANLMTSAGRKCTHEGVFSLQGWDSAIDKIEQRRNNTWWGWEGDSSWMAAPYLDRMELQGIKVVHIVRHPRDVIESMLRMGFFILSKYGNYVQYGLSHAEELKQYYDAKDMSYMVEAVQMAAAWYLAFNKMIEPYAFCRHRIEDDPKLLLDKLEISYEGKRLFDDVFFNHRDEIEIEEVDLNALPKKLWVPLWDMTCRYEYDYSWDYKGGDLTVEEMTGESEIMRVNVWGKFRGWVKQLIA